MSVQGQDAGPWVVTVEQDDDRNCDCGIPSLEGAGTHSPGCACFKVVRQAFATPTEARRWLVETRTDWADADHRRNVVEHLDGSGEPLGPLPDGTTITVEAVYAGRLVAQLLDAGAPVTPVSTPAICAAWNERCGVGVEHGQGGAR